jgi:hypothetical protein
VEELICVIYCKHIVPTINGFDDSEDECTACKMLKAPQRDYNVVYLCERELPEVGRFLE